MFGRRLPFGARKCSREYRVIFPQLTPEDRALTRADGRTKVYDNIVHWARNHLNLRGLLDQLPAGDWRVNQKAFDALVGDLAQRGIAAERAKGFIAGTDSLPALFGNNWSKSVRLKTSAPKTDDEPPLRKGATAVKEKSGPDLLPQTGESSHLNRQDIKDRLLSRMNAIDPYEFEQLIGRVLDSIGFRDTQVVGRSGDEGVDIITYLDSPFVRAKVAVQVKRRSGNVGPRDISYLRDRWTRRSDRLLFVTTSDFTLGAREVAADEHDKPVALVTGDRLAEVMIEHGLGIRTRPQVTYEIDDDYLSGADPS